MKSLTIKDNSGDDLKISKIGDGIEIEAETYGETVFLLFTKKQSKQLIEFAKFILDNTKPV